MHARTTLMLPNELLQICEANKLSIYLLLMALRDGVIVQLQAVGQTQVFPMHSILQHRLKEPQETGM